MKSYNELAKITDLRKEPDFWKIESKRRRVAEDEMDSIASLTPVDIKIFEQTPGDGEG